jgi:hypothetical protein
MHKRAVSVSSTVPAPHNDLWIGTNEVGHQLHGSGYRHRDFYDRYPAAHDRLCREVCIIARQDPDGRNDGDFSNSEADFIFRHF